MLNNSLVPPLSIGDLTELKITDLAFGGRGIARAQNLVVFVPGVIPAETVRVRITSLKKKYAEGELLEILVPSPDRETPPCPYYGRCGGCQYQHLAYLRELSIKQHQLEELFQRLGNIKKSVIKKIVEAPSHYQYRIRGQFKIGKDSNGNKTAGFFTEDNQTIQDIDRCLLMHESINDQWSHEREQQPEADANPNDVELLPLWENSAQVKNLPPDLIDIKIRNKVLSVPTRGFFQINLPMAENLLEIVEEECRELTGGTLVDCYCGCGFFSIFLAEKFKRVLGIEISKESVRCAVKNAKRAELSNCQFLNGKAEYRLEKITLSAHEEVACLLLDPPRSGCSKEVLQAVHSLNPMKIIYISCNPATQARDLKQLLQNSYHLTSLKPLDMFPRTKHIEVVASLVRKEP